MKYAIWYDNYSKSLYHSEIVDYSDMLDEGYKDLIPPYLYHLPKDRFPISLNSVGGYCSFSRDCYGCTFVKFEEYIPDKLPLPFDEYYMKNNKEFVCGWLSPEGDTYSCGYQFHSTAAKDIVDNFFEEKDNHTYNNAEFWLESKGWVRVTHPDKSEDPLSDGILWNYHNSLTNKQIKKLKKIGRFSDDVSFLNLLSKKKDSSYIL